jgi:hypothetical protein
VARKLEQEVLQFHKAVAARNQAVGAKAPAAAEAANRNGGDPL